MPDRRAGNSPMRTKTPAGNRSNLRTKTTPSSINQRPLKVAVNASLNDVNWEEYQSLIKLFILLNNRCCLLNY